MSSQDGYVAADALAALAILGLAVGGLAAGLYTLGRGEWATTTTLAQATSLRTGHDEFARLLRDRGPFRSDAASGAGLEGDARRLEFACGTRRCAAEIDGERLTLTDATGAVRAIRLRGVTAARFAYVGSAGPADRWPPPPAPPPAPAWQGLQAVVLQDGPAGRPLAVGRLAIQQVFDCEFDALIQDCRRAAS